MTAALAPIICKRSVAKKMPMSPMATANRAPIQIACPATAAAPSGLRAPMRRDTIAVTPMPKPMAIAYSTDVHQREYRLHGHLEHHRNGQQAERTADRPGCEIGIVLAQRLPEEVAEAAPEGNRGGVGGVSHGRCYVPLAKGDRDVNEAWPVLLLLALFLAYVLASIVFYARRSAEQWKDVDQSKLKEWKDDDEW